MDAKATRKVGRSLAAPKWMETPPDCAIRRGRDCAIWGMMGVFAQYQRNYAQHGVATFPCSTETKKPLVKNYLKISRGAAITLASKFTNANAIGFATGRRNG